MVAPGPGQAVDLAVAPGVWRDNTEFLTRHTQNPQVNMDDRFDLQLVSGELVDGIGLDYVLGSFQVFGNDGTRTIGAAIDTGTGADPAVLEALMIASDHHAGGGRVSRGPGAGRGRAAPDQFTRVARPRCSPPAQTHTSSPHSTRHNLEDEPTWMSICGASFRGSKSSTFLIPAPAAACRTRSAMYAYSPEFP